MREKESCWCTLKLSMNHNHCHCNNPSAAKMNERKKNDLNTQYTHRHTNTLRSERKNTFSRWSVCGLMRRYQFTISYYWVCGHCARNVLASFSPPPSTFCLFHSSFSVFLAPWPFDGWHRLRVAWYSPKTHSEQTFRKLILLICGMLKTDFNAQRHFDSALETLTTTTNYMETNSYSYLQRE